MKRATLKQLEAEVAKHGATIDRSTGRAGFWNVDAPKGKVWSCSSIHAINVTFENSGGQSFKAAAFADAIERMRYGIDDCDETDCDVCAGE